MLIAALFKIAKKVETAEIATSGWMDKLNAVYTNHGILFSIKQKDIVIHGTT